MRRLVFSVIVASGLVLIGAGPAFAEAAPAAVDAKAEPGKKMCKIVDSKINEISGLVATKTGYIVINDSTDLASRKRVFVLNQDCSIKKSFAYSGNGPRDTEDMVLSADGSTLWIADTGDNDGDRENIAVWKMPVSGASAPKIYRMSYPSGERHDAEALLLTGKNTPIVVTKEVGKPAILFEPTAALKANSETGVPMKKVGEFQPPDTDTASNTLAHLARKTVSGGAVAPGGAKVVLRTYTDAYEWDVTGGDVIAALKATPRKTPLENEPLGEAITYSSDGKYFFTVSDMQGSTETTGENANYILRYTPATKVVTASTDSGSEDDKAAAPAWYKNLSLDDITYIVGGVGLLGAILVGFGVVGIMRARKKPPLEPASKVVDGGSASGPLPTDAETELLAVGGPPGGAAQSQRSGVYGGGPRAGGAQQPGVYGGAPSAPAVPPRGGTPQRGGAPQRGGVYGGQGGGGQQGGRPVPPAGRPAQGGQPVGRPSQGGQPGGQPARAPQGGQPGGQPARAPQGGQPGGRPSQGGQPAGRPPQGGQPARAPQGGQPGGRPPQGGQSGGRPGRGGVYGASPPTPPAPGRNGAAERPGGHGPGQPDGRRQADAGMNTYADASQHYDTRGYGR